MTGSLNDLNRHLFDQLERMANDDMSAEQIEVEAKRAEAIVELADQVTKNADISLKAARLFAEHGEPILGMLPQIGKASSDTDDK